MWPDSIVAVASFLPIFQIVPLSRQGYRLCQAKQAFVQIAVEVWLEPNVTALALLAFKASARQFFVCIEHLECIAAYPNIIRVQWFSNADEVFNQPIS